jgi:hypothetical protein
MDRHSLDGGSPKAHPDCRTRLLAGLQEQLRERRRTTENIYSNTVAQQTKLAAGLCRIVEMAVNDLRDGTN